MALAQRASGSGRADWIVCRRCRTLSHARQVARRLGVCPECGRHAPLSAADRVEQLLDPGSAVRFGPPVGTADPLGFRDSRPYPDRLREARAATGLDEAAICVRGTIDGHPVVAAVMDFRFMGGSLGAGVGDRICLAAETACAERVPLLLVTASGGARMQEGAISLMQLARTSAALAMLDEAGVLTLSLITDPTYGGVAASYATLADVIIAEPGARLGFAGPRVIAQTIRQTLPPGFQTAEHLLEHGGVDIVAPRAELRGTLSRVLAAGRAAAPPADGSGPVPHPASAPSSGAPGEPGAPALVTDFGLLPERPPWETVRRARSLKRPTLRDLLPHLVADFEELHGDRLSDDCSAIVGGVGVFEGRAVLVVGNQKGHTPQELARNDFGMSSPAGYRKAARLMRLAGKLGLPVLTFVDTPGAHPGVEAEERHQAAAIAANLRLMARLPVPIVTVITGEGGSGGALALAVADRVLMLADAVYSVISPEGCAAILWQDPAAAPEAAAALRLDARELLRLGVVDAVVPEPAGGVEDAPRATAARIGEAVRATLRELADRPPGRLLAERLARYRRFAMPPPAAPAARSIPPAAPADPEERH
ncbi:acetyl-CoA carboxylase, carboxyltransferase subunit beta [Actinomadura sp. NAK00032]|uniref:acetyl-CoA carboxylase, carboxyltransferase subunit beta n=1 Tax=Actinomadura sp. NAK00032 TaxID=2742128 RepID=UPI0015929034|nr:acetyl-CoA carboxylase, carboxyltransferase subunit beta [Actinomadura sp. NAK00032]QKW37601.1 acetyl-CoA carboxylase, carboxyltransferase subunit beta [Actinomadura sp. NAK00032]